MASRYEKGKRRPKGRSRKNGDHPMGVYREGVQSKAFPKPTRVGFGGIIGFPDCLGITLKYVDTYQITGTTPAAQMWNMNSLFDPDATGTGHQPDYFDQLKTIYGKYCVIGAEIKLDMTNVSTTTATKIVLTYCDVDLSAFSPDDLAESKYSITRALGNSSGVSMQYLRMPYMETAQIMGQRSVDTDPQMYTATTGSPNDLWYAILKGQAMDEVSAVGVSVRATIYFKCLFKDLYNPGESLAKMSRPEGKFRNVEIGKVPSGRTQADLQPINNQKTLGPQNGWVADDRVTATSVKKIRQ